MMTAVQCPTPKDLKALTLGQLSSEDSDRLFQHVAECDACKSDLETIEDTGDSLIASLRSPDHEAEFSGEPDCQLAVAKALGTLASAGQSASTADLLHLPSSIGEYDIVRPIGHGGMGSVYLAKHTKLGREVALKVLASHRLGDARIRERFEAEMLAVGRLSHPNIVTAHDAREVNGTAVLVTEFVSGMDLGQLLQRTGPLSTANACEIARQIAVALSYTHQQGFVHRDIKPSNVMLSAEGEVKLLDLGLARLQYGEQCSAEITGTGQAMGTADYVAPEQVTDSKSVDIRADIYALGCTLFKLLTGRAPFADDQHTTAFAKMTAHVSTAPPSLSDEQADAPRGLVSLVDSMLAKAPSDRPQTPKQVIQLLTTFCKGHDLPKLSQTATKLEPQPAVSAPSTATNKPATQSWMRRKVPVAAAISAGLLGMFLGVCLSIILIITNPDGTKSILELAEGSSISIQEKAAGGANIVDQSNATVIEVGKHDLNVSISQISEAPMPIVVMENGSVSLPLLEPIRVAGLTVKEAADKIEAAYRESGIFEVKDSIDIGVTLAHAGEPSQLHSTTKLTSPTPLSFGILVNPESTGRSPLIDNLALTAATELLHKTDGTSPVQTEYGTWFEVADDQSTPLKVQNAGKSFALISNQMIITWSEIQGHVLSTQNGISAGQPGMTLNASFDEELGAKFRQLSGRNLRNQLAIIVSGQIRVAPTINSEIGEQVAITGAFSSSEIRQLQQWLHGNLVYPLEHNTASTNDSKTNALPPEASTEPRPKPTGDEKLELASVNLKQIGLAFLNFDSAYGKFPGSTNLLEGGRIRDIQGGRMFPFSWRVAILPFIEQNELFEEYRFDEPWNSESNLKLLDKMPAIYRSPYADDDQEPGESNIIGFAGENTALGIAGGHSLDEFTDDSSNTLLLVEAECSVPWTKPQDIPGDVGNASFFDDHPLLYLMADGSVQSMEKVDTEKLNKMITRNGGERIEK